MTPIRHMTPTRRAMSLTGVAALSMSLVFSIAPVVAANSGTVKVHDALTDADLGNDPHVCAFYAAFYTDDEPEIGTWQLIDWGGDRSIVTSGNYDTSDDGAHYTGVMAPDPGHYRFEWLTNGDRNTKNKTIWVDEECATEAQEPSSSAEPTPSGQPTPSSDPTPTPTEEPSQSVEPSQSQAPSQSGDPSQSTDPSQSQAPSQSQSEAASQSQAPSQSASEAPSQSQSEAASQSQAPSSSQGAQPANPGTPTRPSTQPAPTDASGADTEQQVLTGNSGRPGAGTPDSLPDTAVPVGESGVLATIGLMLIIAAHAGTRRTRQLPAA